MKIEVGEDGIARDISFYSVYGKALKESSLAMWVQQTFNIKIEKITHVCCQTSGLDNNGKRRDDILHLEYFAEGKERIAHLNLSQTRLTLSGQYNGKSFSSYVDCLSQRKRFRQIVPHHFKTFGFDKSNNRYKRKIEKHGHMTITSAKGMGTYFSGSVHLYHFDIRIYKEKMITLTSNGFERFLLDEKGDVLDLVIVKISPSQGSLSTHVYYPDGGNKPGKAFPSFPAMLKHYQGNYSKYRSQLSGGK